MQLILVRHGNTFGPGDKVVMVGSKSDLPLVEKGRDQAHACATALRQSPPRAIYTAPLSRTRETAQIMARDLSLTEPLIDTRLTELDYGLWTGLTDDEIVARFGEASLKAWRDAGRWPADAGFSPSEARVREQIQAFAHEIASRSAANDVVVAVSSNGILRYFLGLIPGELEARMQAHAVKVGTGHMCRLGYESGRFAVLAWNEKPA